MGLKDEFVLGDNRVVLMSDYLLRRIDCYLLGKDGEVLSTE